MKRLLDLIRTSWAASLWAVLLNLALAYVLYGIARLVFLLCNWQLLSPAFAGNWWSLLSGSLLFDTSAIVYTNALWIVLMLLPWHGKENRVYHMVCRVLFVAVNGLALVLNLCDTVYFPYTLRRTTSTVWGEFAREGNLAGIIGHEMLAHWYLVLLAVVLIGLLWWCYVVPRVNAHRVVWMQYTLTMLAALVVAAGLCVAGMRGGFTTAVRPITVSNATRYVDRPIDAALVLNTPFAMIRTAGKDVFKVPQYFADQKALEAVYTPYHAAVDTAVMRRRNVVVLIVESLGREYIGALNVPADSGRHESYTPFVDGLVEQSTTFAYSYCNGRKSIDGMPSILSGIPMFVEPFFLTPASMNHVSGLADVLSKEGYVTAFFHGAQNGSMGFEAFARATGFQRYFGRDEYDADAQTDGDRDFDGTWAIWDEPFLQFYCREMNKMKEPFMTAVFTASSHHPFAVPKQYERQLPDGPLAIHRCIRYTDHALERFFASASRQPWFNNTIFVLTNDHTNMSNHAEYQTDLGVFASPIIIYDPSGELESGMRDRVAQQIDIMPTVLGLLGYGKPYVSFGIDVLNTPAEQTWAVNYLNGIYQLVQDGLVLQFDGKKTTGLYSLDDRLMQHNLVGRDPQQARMERLLKAIIQQYMQRMTEDRLTP